VSSQLSFAPLDNSEAPTVSDTFDLASYDVSYETGRFWDNANVDAQGFDINPRWFYAHSDGRNGAKLAAEVSQRVDRRSSDALSSAILSDLRFKYPDADVKDLVFEQSVEVCLFEQVQSDTLCEVPENRWNDCADMERDSLTGDITISLHRMLNDEGLTQCMRTTRQSLYVWAQSMHQLKDLCAGCYDPFCDRAFLDGQCGLDGNTHEQPDDKHVGHATGLFAFGEGFDWSVVGLGDGEEVMQMYVAGGVVFVVALLAMVVLARRWRSDRRRKEKCGVDGWEKRGEAVYGAV